MRTAAVLLALGAAVVLPPAAQAAPVSRPALVPPALAAGAAPAGTRPAVALPAPAGSVGPQQTAALPESRREHSVWDGIAECESSGDWHINSGNGFFGGLQFQQSTWEEFGGRRYARRADLASPGQQVRVAESVLRVQGWKAWPVCSGRLGLNGRGQAPHAEHPVQCGETLDGIAQKYDVEGGWSHLYEMNRSVVGDDPDQLATGTVLTVS